MENRDMVLESKLEGAVDPVVLFVGTELVHHWRIGRRSCHIILNEVLVAVGGSSPEAVLEWLLL